MEVRKEVTEDFNQMMVKMERDYETRLQQAQEKEQEFSEWRLNKVQEAMAGLATNSIFFCFLFVKKPLICISISTTPHRGNTIFFRSSQQLPRLRLGPLKDFLS